MKVQIVGSRLIRIIFIADALQKFWEHLISFMNFP